MVDKQDISSIFDFTMGNAHNCDFWVGGDNVSADRSRQSQHACSAPEMFATEDKLLLSHS